MYCQKCGAEIPQGDSRCPGCGTLRDGLKFCQHCGQAIDKACVVCPQCGKQTGQIKQDAPQVVINNTNQNINRVGGYGREKNKWIALLLCLFPGEFGAHKFYEGKIIMGILYILTGGLFVIGGIIDLIAILCKPNPYYV